MKAPEREFKPETSAILDASHLLLRDFESTENSVPFVMRDEDHSLAYKLKTLPRNAILARLELNSQDDRRIAFSHPTLGMLLDERCIAAVEYEFRVNTFKREVDIHSKCVCRPECEGRGYSTALAYLTDEVVRNVLRRHESQWKGFSVLGMIDDVAHGQGVNVLRDQWSSSIARALGFKIIGRGRRWGKKYQ